MTWTPGGQRFGSLRFWFPAAPPASLALLRLMVGGFAVIYLAVRFDAFAGAADRGLAGFEPVGVLRPLGSPPPAWLGRVGAPALLLAGLGFVLGWRYRVTGPAFAIGMLLISTLRSSWGQLLWFDNVLVLHLLIVGCSPAADIYSADSRRHAKRGEPADTHFAADERYGVPIRLAAMITVAAYVVSAVAKLRIGGAGWMTGDVLRHHVAFSATRLDVLGASRSPFAAGFVGLPMVAEVASVAAVLLEFAAPLALFGGRLRLAVVLGLWSMHVGIAALMFVVFPYQLALVAFAPLFVRSSVSTTQGCGSVAT